MPKQRKLVTNEKSAAESDSVFSLIALVEAVPVTHVLWSFLVGWILEIGLVVLRGAGKCIWPFLEFDVVIVFGTADVGLVLLHGVQLNIAHSTWVALQCGG